MKIGVIRQDKGNEVCSTCSMETFLGKVKKENKGKYITLLRDRLPSLQGSDDRFIHLDKIPRIYPVAEFRKTAESGWKLKRYNGIVLVEVNRLSGLAEAEYVKSQAALIPQTYAAMVGSSGKSVKIWVRFSLPDGTLPETEEQAVVLLYMSANQMDAASYRTLLDDFIQQYPNNYEGYIRRQMQQVEQFKKLENKIIPSDLDYNEVQSLRLEARQKLIKFRPESVGQAARISGVSPADISVLLVYLEQLKRGK